MEGHLHSDRPFCRRSPAGQLCRPGVCHLLHEASSPLGWVVSQLRLASQPASQQGQPARGWAVVVGLSCNFRWCVGAATSPIRLPDALRPIGGSPGRWHKARPLVAGLPWPSPICRGVHHPISTTVLPHMSDFADGTTTAWTSARLVTFNSGRAYVAASSGIYICTNAAQVGGSGRWCAQEWGQLHVHLWRLAAEA